MDLFSKQTVDFNSGDELKDWEYNSKKNWYVLEKNIDKDEFLFAYLFLKGDDLQLKIKTTKGERYTLNQIIKYQLLVIFN